MFVGLQWRGTRFVLLGGCWIGVQLLRWVLADAVEEAKIYLEISKDTLFMSRKVLMQRQISLVKRVLGLGRPDLKIESFVTEFH